MSTTVRLDIPPSVYALWVPTRKRTRFGYSVQGRARSQVYEAWLATTLPILRGIPPLTLPASIVIEVVGGQGWRINRDLDNAEKAIIDALVTAGRLPDDSTQYLQRKLTVYTEPPGGRRRSTAHVLLTCE